MNEKDRVYEGEAIAVRWTASRCIHSGECVKGLPQVFDPKGRPWIRPDEADPDELAEVVRRCPTGALHYERKDLGEDEKPPDRNVIRVETHGPLVLEGDLEIQDPSGTTILEDTRVALCRCGASESKPFCDGSHVKASFEDAGAVQGVASHVPNPRTANGRLVVKQTPEGPLLVAGSFDLEGSTGCLGFRDGKGALCQCGRSETKPLCDGSHKGLTRS